MKRKLILINGLLIACLFDARAQDTILYTPSASYPFINSGANIIHHTETLEPFYERLFELKEQASQVVSILHIGDSHIQADYLTYTTRTLLQQNFGNAGLGLTFPGRAAHTNESPLIYSSATGQWESNRITHSQNKLPMGIGGASLRTGHVGSVIKLKTINKPPLNGSFNRMTLFFQKDFTSYNIIVKDSTGQSLAFAGTFSEEAYDHVSKLVLPYPINQVQLETFQSLPTQNQFTLFGVSLENSNPGVLYHALGVNGAKYKHFMLAKDLLHQTAALHPDLIIISMGTNEAVDHPNIDPRIDSQINTLISDLKQINPHAIILLTTPADFYKKRNRSNPGIQVIKNKIIDVANQTKLPYWNLYEVAGGNHAADRWKKAKFLQPDGIHFSKKGYELQGHLLFEAIIKGYNEYVLNRPTKTH